MTQMLDEMLESGSKNTALDTRLLNVFTVDLEDWFHVTNFESLIPRNEWGKFSTRLQETVPKLLDILARYDARATFFALGWVAKRFPELLRRIKEAGHELASHGDEHRLITNQSPDEFRMQLRNSKNLIEDASGVKIWGHRAPTYSLRKSTDWAFQILVEEGFQYDSSVFPFGARRDPKLCDSRVPCILNRNGNYQIVEYPLSTFSVFGYNLPIAGGGYFRLIPYPLLCRAIMHLNSKGHRVIMYLHPWELDPGQPIMRDAPWISRFRHYHNLNKTEHKLCRLLSDFRFGSMRDVFYSPDSDAYGITPQK